MNRCGERLLWSLSIYYVAFLQASCTALHDDVSYDELRSFNATCAPYDTCVDRPVVELDSLARHNCACGSLCTDHDTCCIDSPHRSSSRRHKRAVRVAPECVKVFDTDDFYFMVNRCDPKWRGDPEVKSRCELEQDDTSDPFLFIPASAIGRRRTYKNILCGICNNVDTKELRLWEVTLELDRKPEEEDAYELTGQLIYNSSLETWGRWEHRDGTSFFQEVFIKPRAPEYLSEVSGPCIDSLISDCNPSWTDDTVLGKCKSYMAAIYAPVKQSAVTRNLRFRNIHCAMCNYADITGNLTCKTLRTLDVGSRFKPAKAPSLSFTLLLDINTKDGKKVGRVDKCKDGQQSYDPFFKKCRSLVCGLPGYVLEGDKCVKST